MTSPAVTLTVQELDHLEELLAAATPGPWWVWDRGVGYHLAVEDPDAASAIEAGIPHLLPEGSKTDLGRREDAALIAAAVNALPALLATVRRQQAALDAVTELVERAEHDSTATIDNDDLRVYMAAVVLGNVAKKLRTALASPAPTEATT